MFGRAEAPSEPRWVIRVLVNWGADGVYVPETWVPPVRGHRLHLRAWSCVRGRAEAPSEPCWVIRVLVNWGCGRSLPLPEMDGVLVNWVRAEPSPPLSATRFLTRDVGGDRHT